MPYIKLQDKEVLNSLLEETLKLVSKPGFCTAGDLNYIFTMFAQSYLKGSGLNYNSLNTIVGVFESAKAEFQRRVVVPYEDGKIEENGDVYQAERVSNSQLNVIVRDINGEPIDWEIQQLRKS